MNKICFAILAHGHRQCVDDLIANLHRFCPTAEIVLFNGGSDTKWTEGLDVPICPYSTRLYYCRTIQQFHFRVMRWLHEEKVQYDFLALIDSDMMLIKPGYEDWLSRVMKDSEYMAVNFAETKDDTDWENGRPHRYHWKRIWQPIFKTANPYQCFNPGQIFRRELVEKWMAFEKHDELLRRVERSRIPVLEETVFATLAVTLDGHPMMDPTSQTPPARDRESQTAPVRWTKRHSPKEIQTYLEDENVFILHPVPMKYDAPERRLIRNLSQGNSVSFDDYERQFQAEMAIIKANLPKGVAAMKDFLRGKARTVYRGAMKLYVWAVPQ